MQLYNPITQNKEQLKPLSEKKILMYVCGITPYDTTHLGHAFTYVFFDTVQRYLRFTNYDVVYTQNVTDIDDDILKRAKQTGRDWKELGQYWTNRFLKDLQSLRVAMPTHYVKATDSIPKIIEIIQMLKKNVQAYERSGNVYFDVATFPEYGALSHFTKQQMLLISKERGANPNDPNKKHSLDFILWQKSGNDEPGWDSPFGRGRPGWHIECSAMSNQYLGDQIDIHGGGRDLAYPHHESEIAQSESFTGKKPFAKYWMHTAMVMYQGEKMSKSLGNLIMVKDLLQKYSWQAVRLLLLSHHYRTPWEYAEDELKQIETIVPRIQEILTQPSGKAAGASHPILNKFMDYLDDDFNTYDAVKLLLSFVQKKLGVSSIKTCLSILGIEA